MPRRKLTKVDDLPKAELPELTDQQFAFVKGLLDGKTATDAYRAAYDCSNSQPETIWAHASRLRADDKVAAWLDAARQAYLGSAKITLDQHVQRLDELRTIAVKTGNVGAAVAAEQTIGKVLGHHVERYEEVIRDPLEVLASLAREAPETARAIAQELGLPEPEATTH